MKRIRTLALACCGLAAMGQSMFRGDAAHTGVYAGAGPFALSGVKWKFTTGGGIFSSPVWSGGVLFFGSDDHNVYAVDAASGRQKWKFATGGPVPSTPAVSGGVVYFESYDGRFYAVEELSGKLKWKFATGGERRFEAKGIHGQPPSNQTMPDAYDIYLSSPVVADGAVFFGSGDRNIYALDAALGTLRWKFATGDVVHSSPAFSAGTIYAGGWDSVLYAIDAATGKEKWRFQAGIDPDIHNQVGFQGSPAVADGVVYVGCRDSNFYAIDAATGMEKWKFNNQTSWVVNSPAVTEGKVIFGTSDSRFFRVLDAATGKTLSQLNASSYLFSSPAVAGDAAYVGVMNGGLMAVDWKTGKTLWEFQTEASRRNDGWFLNADRTANPTMMYRGEFFETFTIVSRLFSLGSIASSPLVKDGVVYFGSADGSIYALR